jgi:hypothetical protein
MYSKVTHLMRRRRWCCAGTEVANWLSASRVFPNLKSGPMVDYGFRPVSICGLGGRFRRIRVAIHLNIDFVEYLFPGSTSPPSNPTSLVR